MASSFHRHTRLLCVAIATGTLLPLPVIGATDLSDVPLSSATTSTVKPNIFFILDDSGSMDSEYMPDALADNTTRIRTVGFRNHQCNTIYYNPNTTYVIPPTSAGANVNNASQTTFADAYDDGYYSYDGGSSTSKTNLSSNFRAFYNLNISFNNYSDSAQPAYYWTYLGGTTLAPVTGDCEKTLSAYNNSTTTEICTDNTARGSDTTPTTCAGDGKTALWRKIIVSSTSGPGSTDERQNFANWYSYYRTRLMMMKAAAGRAFLSILDNYRVGFMTISPGTYGNSSGSDGSASGSSISSNKFLKIDDFDSTHREDWYDKLYSQTTASYTPLRSALSTAGRYYAGKNDLTSKGMVPSQADDPVQYSCQQNFTILTTDGYWNSGSGRQVDGTSQLGNQDGVYSELDAYNPGDKKFAVSPKPIYDGAITTYVWNSATNQYQYASCTTTTTSKQQRTVQWQSRTLVGQEERTSRLQQRTWQLQARTSTLQKRTRSGGVWGAWGVVTSCDPGASNTQCRYSESTSSSDSWTDWANTSSCDPESQDTSGTWNDSNSTARQCQYVLAADWTNVGSCDAVAQDTSGTWSVGTAVDCQYTAWSAWATNDACVALARDTTDPYSVGVASECQPRYSAWANSAACAPSATCQAVYTSWTNVASCTASGPDAGGYGVECQDVSGIAGKRIQYKATKYAVTWSGPNQTGSIISNPPGTTDSSWSNYDSTCYPDGLQAAFPSTTVTGSGPPSAPASCSPVTTWPCETTSTSGGSSNSLADVAQYYYKTDLRTSTLGNCTGALGINVCDNNVPSTGTDAESDKANWQHMTTFTMGLGLSGNLAFSPTYKTDTTGTFDDIRDGNTNWPVPSSGNPSTIDDLWHAAVNGRGQYFSAKDPNTVVDSLQTALSGVSARVASAAAAATSNLEPVAGDNFAYTAKYVTQKWTGELEAREIDLATGSVSSTAIWSAAAKLSALTASACDNRNIKLFRSGATNNLVDFKWNTAICVSGLPSGSVTTLNATEQAHFASSGTDTLGLNTDEIALLSQFPNMSATQKSDASGAHLVNYLRGQRGKEGFESGPPATNTAGDADKLFRTRDGVLGDIISAQPVFVRSPFAEYTGGTDPGYSTYKENQAGRTPMVYVAANDGMLHAFYAGSSVSDTNGGVEAWAFIPTMVLPNLYKMASENYANLHVFTVDGTPTAADVFDRTASADCAAATPANPELCWKTILVSGLNKGGKGYYALDITDPANPKGLWEFKNSSSCLSVHPVTKVPTSTTYSDCHLGYSYNNPIIAKLSDGRWAAFVTSGYNNDDGIGYLYVLDAITGQVLYRISTGTGDATNQSGLNHLNGWVNNALFDNTIQRIYGADLLGNIWRFDVNDNFGDAGREATLVAQVVDDSNQPQSITTKLELGEVTGDPFIFVGTGRYLGTTDVADTQTQTVWAIKDPLTTTPVTNLRTALVERTIVNNGSGTSAYRTVTAANCAAPDGWYADLPDSGERVNIDMKLQLGTLIVPTNVPTSNACSIGGYSWLNYFNSHTGCPVSTASGKVGVKLVGATGTESLAVGINVVRLPNGKTVVIATTSGAEQITLEAPFDTPPPVGKRVSWREIVQ